MLSELSADVERQRFRLPSFGREAAKGKENSAKKSLHGDVPLDDAMHSLGHSLTRIAAALCLGYAKVVHLENTAAATLTPGPYRIPPGSGMMELLSKCASHPSVSICGIVLPVITPVLKTQTRLATQWLPTLQRRAIIPHHPNNVAILSPSSHSKTVTSDKNYIPLLAASDICFVEFEEFIDRFRETVLADALNACYSIHSEYYLASCTAAIEEFCVGDAVTEQTSFHLEAALFCLAVVAEQVLSGLQPESPGSRATSPNPGSKLNAIIPSYLLRCTAALAKKPKSLNNSLTMVQACRFMRNVSFSIGKSIDGKNNTFDSNISQKIFSDVFIFLINFQVRQVVWIKSTSRYSGYFRRFDSAHFGSMRDIFCRNTTFVHNLQRNWNSTLLRRCENPPLSTLQQCQALFVQQSNRSARSWMGGNTCRLQSRWEIVNTGR